MCRFILQSYSVSIVNSTTSSQTARPLGFSEASLVQVCTNRNLAQECLDRAEYVILSLLNVTVLNQRPDTLEKVASMFLVRTILIVFVFLLGPFSAMVQAQDKSKEAPKKPPIVPAEKLAEGWEQIDDRLIFLMVRLASTEASLEATENAIATSSQNQNRKTRQAKQSDKKNEDMDRQGGGPLKWSLFYGRTAESFFYHPTDRNTTYHTTTILSQQAPLNDNQAAAGVPSRQGLPVHQRPPQFDYIYRANESAKARAEKEVAELGGKTAELTDRRQRLEAEQAGLWCEIAFRSVSHYDLDKKPLYRFEPLLSANSNGDSRVQFETMRGAASFMALALSIVDAAQKDQLTTFSKIKPAVAKARQDLNDAWLRNGVDVTERKSLEGKFHALAKRLEESASNLSDSYVVALEGDLAKDQQRKDTFRALLQESLIRYAEIILALDEMATLMKDDWKVKPDVDKPIQFLSLSKLDATWVPNSLSSDMKRDASDSVLSKSVEVFNLDEINSPGNDVNPSLTRDGLNIVWQSAVGDETFIYEATRTAPEAQFSKPKRVLPGFNPVIVADGQSLYFYNPSSKTVNESRRIANSRDFGRPVAAPGLEMVAYPTGITEDGLTLYLDIHSAQKDDGSSPAHVTTRSKRSDKWRRPVPLNFSLLDKPFRHRVMAVCPVPGDDSAITCNLIVQSTKDSQEENRAVIMTRSEPNGPFSDSKALIIPNATGEQRRFFSPRYIPATQELVFQSNQHFVDLELGKKMGVDLWLAKEVDIKSVGARKDKDNK